MAQPPARSHSIPKRHEQLHQWHRRHGIRVPKLGEQSYRKRPLNEEGNEELSQGIEMLLQAQRAPESKRARKVPPPYFPFYFCSISNKSRK